MVSDLTNSGEEVMQKATWVQGDITLPTTIEMLLYNDTTDALSDTSDDPATALTSEPSTGNYVRKTLDLDGSSTNDGNVTASGGANYAVNIPSLSWDVTNTTGSVDAYALVMTVDLDVDTAGATAHLVFSQSLDRSYDLSQLTTLDTNAFDVMSLD